LSFQEFKKASKVVEKFSGPIDSLEEVFAQIDEDKSGTVDFDEFCDWAIKRSFSNNGYEMDDIQEKEGKLKKYI